VRVTLGGSCSTSAMVRGSSGLIGQSVAEPQMAAQATGNGVDQKVQHDARRNQDHRPVNTQLAEGGVNIKSQCGNDEQNENGSLAHDDFPAIQQEGEKIRIDTWQYFKGITVQAVTGIAAQGQAVGEATAKMSNNGAGMQGKGKDARQHGRAEQQHKDKGQ